MKKNEQPVWCLNKNMYPLAIYLYVYLHSVTTGINGFLKSIKK